MMYILIVMLSVVAAFINSAFLRTCSVSKGRTKAGGANWNQDMGEQVAGCTPQNYVVGDVLSQGTCDSGRHSSSQGRECLSVFIP